MLLKVKRDLHDILLAGDQQTYALVKDLQRRYPDRYTRMVVLHGDWQTPQLLAEDIIWDGGFKQICYECGYKNAQSMARNTYVTIGTLRVSLHNAVQAHIKTNNEEIGNSKKFWDWLTSVASDKNNDQNSKFWSRSYQQVTVAESSECANDITQRPFFLYPLSKVAQRIHSCASSRARFVVWLSFNTDCPHTVTLPSSY